MYMFTFHWKQKKIVVGAVFFYRISHIKLSVGSRNNANIENNLTRFILSITKSIEVEVGGNGN